MCPSVGTMQEDASHCRLREVADKSARERQVERLWADLPFHPLRLKRLHLRLGYSQAILNPYLGLGILSIGKTVVGGGIHLGSSRGKASEEYGASPRTGFALLPHVVVHAACAYGLQQNEAKQSRRNLPPCS